MWAFCFIMNVWKSHDNDTKVSCCGYSYLSLDPEKGDKLQTRYAGGQTRSLYIPLGCGY